jgi:hypothetical protein
MPKVFITEHYKPSMYAGQLLPVPAMPPIASQVVAIGGASAQSTAFNADTKLIGVHTDAICSIAIGANPTATADSRRLAANATEYFEVFPGHKIAVITNT